MGIEHAAQLVDLLHAHALGGQATGHTFERLADFIEFDQLGRIERDHPRTDMGDAHQQTLPLQTVDGLAQRATADAIGARQLGLGDLAAGRDVALDDGRLDAAKHMLGQGFAILGSRGKG